jgi:hypothetical protein
VRLERWEIESGSGVRSRVLSSSTAGAWGVQHVDWEQLLLHETGSLVAATMAGLHSNSKAIPAIYPRPEFDVAA